MFDIGFQELIIIFIVALIVFGPKRLPEVGRTFGRWVVDIRNGIQNIKVQMDEELEDSEKKPPGDIIKSSSAEEKENNKTPDQEKIKEKE